MNEVKKEITITGRTTVKKGKWYVVLNLPRDRDGKRKEKWIATGLDATKSGRPHNVNAAKQELDRLRLEYSQMEYIATPNLTAEERTILAQADESLDVYAMKWLEKRRKSIKGKKLQQTTYDSYKQLINCHIKGYFTVLQELKLKDITHDDIFEFYEHLIDEKELTVSTVIKYHNLLHSIFKDAFNNRVIQENPFVKGDITKPEADVRNVTYYNATEMRKMFDCLGDDPLRLVVIIAAYYGLRRSEVLGLKWNAIDFDDNKIHIQHKVVVCKEVDNGLFCSDELKTTLSRRTFELIPEVKEELLKQKKKQEEMRALFGKSYNEEYKEYVCTDALGKIIKPNYITTHFPLFLEKNNLKRIRFHDLRHSCASNMLSTGSTIKEIQVFLGHSNISTTGNIYAHIDAEASKQSVFRIQNAYSRSENNTSTN